MPIPENPQSRSEQYLNAIATGDNSGLPAFPESRMEQYLEVIAQNGGGGSSGGGVFIVHVADNEDYTAAVLDKTWREIKTASATSVVIAVNEIGDSVTYLLGITTVPFGTPKWKVSFFNVEGTFSFETTDGEDAYPEMRYE